MTTNPHLTVDMGLVLTAGAEVRAEVDRSDLARQSNTPVSVSVSAPGDVAALMADQPPEGCPDPEAFRRAGEQTGPDRSAPR